MCLLNLLFFVASLRGGSRGDTGGGGEGGGEGGGRAAKTENSQFSVFDVREGVKRKKH